MEKLIVAISGKKGSGKNTFANQILAKYYNNAQSKYVYTVNRLGQLGCDGEIENWHSISDLHQVNFADPIKDFCMDALGLTYKQCHGTDEDKNSYTDLSWDDTPVSRDNPTEAYGRGLMTAREVMQYFGTDIMRGWIPDIWVRACIRKIVESEAKIVLVTDCRFPDELAAIQAIPDAKTVRLERNPYNDQHASETALDNTHNSAFDFIVPDLPSVAAQGGYVARIIDEWLAELE